MSQNPNWPVMDYGICLAAGPTVDPTAQSFWLDVGARTEGQTKILRGKTYELDQVQPAEMDFTLRNDDGAFDPSNAASPYAGFVIPYRLCRLRAQWPPTVNLLTQNQATAGEATLLPLPVEQPEGVGALSSTVWVAQPMATVVAADGTAFQGANVYASTVPPSTTYPARACGMTGWSVAPLTSYSVQCRARSSTASVTATVRIDIEWRNAAGAVISTTTGSAVSIAAGPTAAWTQITISATSPAGACGATAYLTAATGPATTWTLQSDAWQTEIAAAPSSYTTPSPWYPLYTGYVERWPQTWTSGGNYGTSDLTAVDGFSYLANQDALAAALAEVLVDGPDWFYPLNEPTGAVTFSDLTGKQPPLKPANYGAPAASQLVAGTTITDAFASGPPLGLPGPAVTFTNHGANGGIGLDLGLATGILGPPVGTGWTRIFAFKMPVGTPITTLHTIWSVVDPALNNYITVQVRQTTGDVFATIHKNGVTMATPAMHAGPVNVGHWMLVALSMNASGTIVSGWGDTPLSPNQVTTGSDMRPSFIPGSVDTVGVQVNPDSNTPVLNGLTADVALIAQLPYDIASADVIAGTPFAFQYIYNAFYGAFRVNSNADQRYKDILAWARYMGAARISTGHTTSYGPATDLPGEKTLDALQKVVDTEAGQHFVAADGAITFQSRVDRYNRTPLFTLGENTGAGEIPYLGAATDYDPTRVANDVQITEQDNNRLYRRIDGPPNPANNPPKSQDSYGVITFQRTVNSTDPLECDAAAQYYLYQYKQPQQRLEAVVVDVAANPANAWSALLGRDLGTPLQVNRRPSNAPVIAVPGFLEQITWQFDDQGHATWTGQVSNSALHTFWIIGETRMTLNTSTLVNAGSMIVNALADAATNPIAANISAVDQISGNPEWLIDAGTPNAEFVTVLAVPVTSPGYTTATLTVGLCYDAVTGLAQSGFWHPHSAGAVIQDAGGIFTNIGGTVASLAALLQPAGQYDAEDVVGSTTIVGY